MTHPDTTIDSKLEKARRDLLDLTTRNRLLSTPRTSTRSGRLEIVGELSAEVFRILVRERKPMTFLPGIPEESERRGTDEETRLLLQPNDDVVEDGSLASHHVDHHLQTRLRSDGLQRRLLKLFYDARTFEEEQGVNILYLAIGFLKWFEDEKSERERFAPLLLIPVELDRRTANARFRLQYTDDDIATNLSLQEKLKVDFGIRLPDVPDLDDLSPDAYYAELKKAIAQQRRWEVLPNDIVLWFFSFSKFLMYRDLQPDTWPSERRIERHPLITSLLEGGFRPDPPICSDGDQIDRVLQPRDMTHILDADSSQAIAIEEVGRSKNLVVQGPPGTGKSQTIANLIAAAVKKGKKVLFVAEKMAALEVVKRRMDNVGLGPMCLELHSHKANKRAVLEELANTLELGRPKVGDVTQQAEDLKSCRDRLNRHAEVMHAAIEPVQLTPYQIIGELVRLRSAGVQPADFKLTDALTWTKTSLQDKLNVLEDLAVHMRDIGNPQEHPCRGVRLEVALPTDIDRLKARLPALITRLGRLTDALNDLSRLLQTEPVISAWDASRAAQFGQELLKAPPMDRQSLGNAVWRERREQIDELIRCGQEFASCQAELRGVVATAGWSMDVAKVRRDLAAHGRSLFRIFLPAYRRAQAALRGILEIAPPKRVDERLRILNVLIRGQGALKAIENDAQSEAVARNAFGSYWNGVNSDWTCLESISRWEAEARQARNVPGHFRDVMASLSDMSSVDVVLRRIAQDLKPAHSEALELSQVVQLDLNVAFGHQELRLVPLSELRARLESWQADLECLSKWIVYYVRWSKLEQLGLGELAQRLDEGAILSKELFKRFQMAYYEELIRDAYRRYPELAAFDGISHEEVLRRFRELDLERIALARQEVALAHFQGLPRSGGAVGEVGVLYREMKKKRRHLPLRKLVQQAGHAIQAIKPVFMMSPISIAQFLEPGILEFDLLLIDEASQVRPVDSLGAISRTKQVVVVGDDRQLPPTRFFSRLIEDEITEATDAEDFEAADVESILGLCVAQNMAQRMLQWHYRSRHHSLIAVSNREFYNDKLFVVPNPVNQMDGLGLRFRYVPGGMFDRGGSATNRVEAGLVADAVIEHVQECSTQTLGVGAFSVSQRDAILDELELRRRSHPDLEDFFATGTAEPFFVKNLENIQGDERDVIFISVGYGRDSSGYMAMSFGPLSNEGGERRLNVLITRARERCEVFSSITADEIDLERARSRGAQALKTFLTYAQSGVLDIGVHTGRAYESEFEREVARAISQLGYQIDAQVGVAGFFVDLAVVDPDCPGRYLLGIECDGACYHASRSARDRDRLRQQVLEDRGWIIHRIWSSDWFHRPEEQLRRVMQAIERAKVEWARRSARNRNGTRAHEPPVPEALERHEVPNSAFESHEPIQTVPYEEANFPATTDLQIHELRPEELATVVVQVVKIEGPIHQDEIARRVATLWGLKRTGNRIADAVEAALAEAVFQGQVKQDGLFFRHAGQNRLCIRNRQNVQSGQLRKPEYLPPIEIRAALLLVVRTHFGASLEEAVTEVARLFGFQSTSGQLRQIIQDEVRILTEQCRIEQRNGKLYAQPARASARR